MKRSRHLDRIIQKEDGVAHMQVVFCDVQAYSKRSTWVMAKIIRFLNALLKQSLRGLELSYAEYLRENRLSFRDDVLTLPTGDGAAVVFAFSGLHDVHLLYAATLLGKTLQVHTTQRCLDFERQGWCNCHPYMNLRIGVSSGRGIIYEDLNGQYNVAGEAVNNASRAMSLAQPNQVLLTEAAFQHLVDLSPDNRTSLDFTVIKDAVVKHGVTMTVYAYKRVRPVLRFSGAKTINDTVESDIVANSLTVTKEGSVVGDILAERVEVFGRVRGKIRAAAVYLCSGCVVAGHVTTSRLVIEEGADFRKDSAA